VWTAAFNPSGSRIVSVSLDKTIRIWDVATARQIAALRRRGTRYVASAAFHPDGSRIVVASGETARIWGASIATMSTKQLIAEVCLQLHGLSRLTRDEMRLVGYAEDAAEIDVCG